jgi:polyisoprenoid-binding protein YceI
VLQGLTGRTRWERQIVRAVLQVAPLALMTRSTPRPPRYVAGTWTIDSARSTVAFTIRHLLLHKVRGMFGAFTGQIVTGNEVTRSFVSAQIDLDSLDTGDAGRDKGTLAKDPFDIAHHPVMTYHSTGLAPDGQAWQLEGELTLRGITQEVSLRVQQYEFTSGTTGERRARFFATGNINRQAFGVRFPVPLDGRGVLAGNAIGIELLIEAILWQAGV